MPRREFPRSVRVAVIKRATVGGVVYCDNCCNPAKKFQIDHANPDGLTGKPTLDNAKLICIPCHKDKTRFDVADIARAKRREAAALGAKPAPRQKIAQRGKPVKVPRDRLEMPPRRNLYVRIR